MELRMISNMCWQDHLHQTLKRLSKPFSAFADVPAGQIRPGNAGRGDTMSSPSTISPTR